MIYKMEVKVKGYEDINKMESDILDNRSKIIKYNNTNNKKWEECKDKLKEKNNCDE